MIKQIYKKLISEKKRKEVRNFIKKAFVPLYYGKEFTCNCCKKSFRRFRTKGRVNPRKNAECPNCGSLERTRVLDFYLHDETNLYTKKGLKVLHFAPEQCLYNDLKQLDIEYIDGDITPYFANYVIDITKIPYTDNYFDFIICSHVLAHVPNEEDAILELVRVLKSTGSCIIMSNIDQRALKTFEDVSIITEQERLKNYSEPDLCRLHGKDFQKRLEKGGFLVKEIDYRMHFTHEDQKKFQLGDGRRELIFKCTKI